MSERLWAVVNPDGVVSNVIVAAPEFIESLPGAVVDPSNDTGFLTPDHEYVEVTDLDPQPSVNWTYLVGAFAPPPAPPAPPRPASLVAEPDSIPPNGRTQAVVTYTLVEGDTEAAVTFTANGVSASRPVVDGAAVLKVSSTTPGDTVVVTCGELSCTVNVYGAVQLA